MNPRINILAAAAALCMTISAPAHAGRHNSFPAGFGPVTNFCGDRVCSTARSPRAQRQAHGQCAAARSTRHPSKEVAQAPSAPPNDESARPEWPRTLHKDAPTVNGSGVVRSAKTGATAHVSPRYASAFQAYVDDLEDHGAVVKFMGGYRKGTCWSGGRHPCGMALDVCQLRRGVVDSKCHLPGPSSIARIAAAHGLLEGAVWGSSDYGHAQAAGQFGNNYSSSASARSHHHGR